VRLTDDAAEAIRTLDPEPRAERYPALRFMGSKHRLLPWLREILDGLAFRSALDAFSGSGCVSYLMKTMGKQVWANDFLRFAADLSRATVANSAVTLSADEVNALCHPNGATDSYIERTFRGIFFEDADNRFLDVVWSHLPQLDESRRALALASLYRACLKRQPRGVFTVPGLGRYDDGRRDLRLTIEEHFREGVSLFNNLVFDNGCEHRVTCGDAMALQRPDVDLVYLDPPYVPRSDDNCYIKRYHFLEGLSTRWQGVEFHATSKVKKLRKRYTPFSYRKDAPGAFDQLFRHFADSAIVLSYSSNGFPDLEALRRSMRRYKRNVEVFERPHRYHFGTHGAVSKARAQVTEYLLVGI
jgi:DNA adenine methylase/adenine-specific DNA-methyltransferase